MNNHYYIKYFLTLAIITFSAHTALSQTTDCTDHFIRLKDNPANNDFNLKSQLDALDSLLTKCKYEDKEWIEHTLKIAIERKDTLINHTLPWTYYVYLYRREERANDATELLDQLITYSEDNGYKLSGDYYVERGLKYGFTSDYALQLEAYQKGLNAYRRDNSINEIYALGVIGLFYLDLGELDKAKKYKLDALDFIQTLTKEEGRDYLKSNTAKDLGSIYTKLDSLKKAEKYYTIALEVAKIQRNINLTIAVYDDNINFHIERENFALAEKLITEADRLINENETRNTWDLKPQFTAYHDLTKSKYGMKTNQIEYVKDPKLISTDGMSNAILKIYYQFAIDYTSDKNKITRAFDYSQKLNRLIEKEINKQKVSVTDLVLEKQNNAILQKENILLLDTERKRSNLQYIYLAIVSILAAGLFFLYYYLKKSRQYNRILNGSRKRIEAQYKELERITYVMTHDLKEPINTVNSFSELILDRHVDGLDDRGKGYFNIIYSSSKTMLRSVNSLHNHLLIGLKSKPKKCNLESIWLDAQTNLKAVILQNSVQIQSDPLPILYCYESEITTLFQSLLSNSIKYSKKGIVPKITLECKEYPPHFKFAFSDNGIGLNPDSKDTIFDLFKRVNEDPTIEGSGIGLANARKIVDYHKGEIWVESTLHKGSTFYFTISKDLN